MMQQNTSIIDSNNPAAPAQGHQSRSDIDDQQSQGTSQKNNQNEESKEKYKKITNVFKMLIEEADYLIDDRSYERCEGKNLKEQFRIKIDSIRKSLGIDCMQDVDLLVDSLYGHEARHKQH